MQESIGYQKTIGSRGHQSVETDTSHVNPL